MRRAILIIIVAFLVMVVGGMIVLGKSKFRQSSLGEITKPSSQVKVESKMKLASPAFSDNSMIPKKFTCDDENISPPFSISEVPEATKSLVLVVDDPDAPSGDWVHWTVWNIKPAAKIEIMEGVVPAGGVQGVTDFGKVGWGGPCPPSGTHHYQFKLYAVDTVLDLSESATKKDIEKAMEEHLLDQTLLVGLYQRK